MATGQLAEYEVEKLCKSNMSSEFLPSRPTNREKSWQHGQAQLK